ncbi:MAG: hypothetical protein Q8Q37_03260 [bacterium]|nr:hypothetical protein [bacterium]
MVWSKIKRRKILVIFDADFKPGIDGLNLLPTSLVCNSLEEAKQAGQEVLSDIENWFSDKYN